MRAAKLREGGQWLKGPDGKLTAHYPDEKISQVEIAARQAAAKKLELFDFRENVRMLSPTQAEDLRNSLRHVQAGGDSASSLRALRMIEVLDWYEAAQRERQALEQVIADAGELSDEALELHDGFDEHLKRNRTDAVAELFADNPAATHEQLADLVGEFVEKAFAEAEKDIRGKVQKLKKAVELHLRAMEGVRHAKE